MNNQSMLWHHPEEFEPETQLNQAQARTRLSDLGYTPAHTERAIEFATRKGSYNLPGNLTLTCQHVPVSPSGGSYAISLRRPVSPVLDLLSSVAHVHDDDGTAEGCPGCFWDPDQQTAAILTAIMTADRHLDAMLGPGYENQPLALDWSRITKVCEEAGEVWKAHSKLTGENPRKGVCGTENELLEELGDTASAALCAIQHITKDVLQTWSVFMAALAKAYQRVPEDQR